jgi:hypothetical protein
MKISLVYFKRGKPPPAAGLRDLVPGPGLPPLRGQNAPRFAVARASQGEEKAAWMLPAAGEGGPEARNRMLRAEGTPATPPNFCRTIFRLVFLI